MSAIYQGTFSTRKRGDLMPVHRWVAYGTNAENFIRSVLPFLIAKSAEAQLLLDFWAWRRARASFAAYSDAERSEADSFRARLRALRTTSKGQLLREAAL